MFDDFDTWAQVLFYLLRSVNEYLRFRQLRRQAVTDPTKQ